MPVVEFQGYKFETDEEGFLNDLNNWNEAWINYVKKSEGIETITEDHLRVIKVFQEYFKNTGTTPRMSTLIKNTGFKLKYIYELFPSGPGKGACRMAGLPKPTGCV
jgi:dissimilatory sulfite reductase related protein